MWGPATTDDVDTDRQIVDPEFASRGLSKWLATGGNIREMHQPKAIGLGVELIRKDNQHWLRSRIVEPTAVKLAEEKVLRAYSVGIANAKIDYAKNQKARGGTIVDGDFVEVSLVDRPANAACKVDIVKSADDGTAVWTDIVKAAMVAAPEVTAEVRKVWALEDVVYKKDYSQEDRQRLAKEHKALPDGSYPIADAEDLHNAYMLAKSGHGDAAAAKSLIARRAKELGVSNPFDDDGGDVSKAAVPECDQEVTEDLERADDAVHDARGAQAKDNAAHERGDDDEDAMKGEIPYVVKRLHDHLCAAYSPDAVKDEYPACPTVGDAVDVGYWAKAVSVALADDAGSGQLAHMLAMLSDCYGSAVQIAHTDKAVLDEARALIHKAFADMYPSVTVRPSAVTPGQFRRPFIGGGRAQMHSTGHPRIPLQSKVPDASDFTRPYLTSHTAANSPAAGAPNGPAAEKRQFYSNNSRDQAAQMMTSLHDYIVAFHPGVCPMQSKVAEPPEQPTPIDPNHKVPNEAEAKPTARAGYTKVVSLEGLDVDTLEKMIDERAASTADKLTKKLKKQNKKLAEKCQNAEGQTTETRISGRPGCDGISRRAYRSECHEIVRRRTGGSGHGGEA